tara:strand:- start:35 stop:1042 length:1008 start_codon:yes stop_codon:yes gene_type:complete
MKKFSVILFLNLFLFSNTASGSWLKPKLFNPNTTSFKSGEVYEGEVVWEKASSLLKKESKVYLPDGKWQFMEKFSASFSVLSWEGILLVHEDNKMANGIILMQKLAGNRKATADVVRAVSKFMYKNKYDGCYERPEYYFVKFFKSLMSNNCFAVRHLDTQKKMYNNNNPRAKNEIRAISKWLNGNNAKLPPILLCSRHYYFSPLIKDTLYIVDYCENPETIGGPKNNFFTEETSEYYRPNINNHSEHKNFMEEWVKVSAKRHKLFQKNINAKEKHNLDFDELGVGEVNQEFKAKTLKSSSAGGASNELGECVKLSKAGELSKKQLENCIEGVLGQ